MGKIFFSLIFLLLANNVLAEEALILPADFLDFYKKFRLAVVAKSYGDVTSMTCFPFKAFDNTETLGRGPYSKKLRRIEKKTFVKYELAKYFLTQAGDISSDEPVVVNGLANTIPYFYKNNEQLIIENEDPRNIKRLPENSSRYSSKFGKVFMNEMEFEKKRNDWCWSYASYMRDENDKW